jgi:DNA-binding NarL/FixJ family response regulator
MIFTKRELEIMKYICEGFTDKEISISLFISLSTVKFHVTNIFKKANVKNRTQLMAYCIQQGYLKN